MATLLQVNHPTKPPRFFLDGKRIAKEDLALKEPEIDEKITTNGNARSKVIDIYKVCYTLNKIIHVATKSTSTRSETPASALNKYAEKNGLNVGMLRAVFRAPIKETITIKGE